VGILVHGPPEPVATELEVDRVAVPRGDGADRGRNVTETVARPRGGDGGFEGFLAGSDELDVVLGRGADDDGECGVGHPAVDAQGEVHAQDIAVAQGVVVRESVQDRVVDRKADDVAERAAAEGRGVVPVAGVGTAFFEHVAGVVFQVEQVDPYFGAPGQLGQHVGDELSGDVHSLDLTGGLELNHRHAPYP